ncbi:hypothetical protein DFH09DRAFT_1494130 [Mycena vulgaris]|nr:hypothetical protein DFH09DRAFT_1494130 [Mycena vulgaris]
MASSESGFIRSYFLPAPGIAEIRDLLHSYAQPPPDHLSSTLPALSAELARYDTEISRLRAELSAVECDRAMLQDHYEGCRSLLSPIRWLPSEILAEIFTLHMSPLPLIRDSLEVAISLLAQKPLLALSQVCARWHHIVMGTPALWATIHLNDVSWRTDAGINKAMVLLQAALERSRTSLLSVTVTALDIGYGPALKLLAAHSERWQMLEFIPRRPELGPYLGSAKGRLPHLETLKLWAYHQTLALRAHPLHQLREFRCEELVGLARRIELEEKSPVLSLMPRLVKGARLDLELRPVEGVAPFDETTTLPPVTSDVSVAVEKGFLPSNVGQAISTVIGSLTLPGLHSPGMISPEYPRLVLPWPHPELIALAACSAFHTHLQFLEIYHFIGNLGADQLLVTDSLLERLTPAPHAPSLVPRLRSFKCKSQLQFDDEVYLSWFPAFAAARRAPQCRALREYDLLAARPPKSYALEKSSRYILEQSRLSCESIDPPVIYFKYPGYDHCECKTETEVFAQRKPRSFVQHHPLAHRAGFFKDRLALRPPSRILRRNPAFNGSPEAGCAHGPFHAARGSQFPTLGRLHIDSCSVSAGERIDTSSPGLSLSTLSVRHIITSENGIDHWIPLLRPDHLRELDMMCNLSLLEKNIEEIPSFPQLHKLAITMNLAVMSRNLAIFLKFPSIRILEIRGWGQIKTTPQCLDVPLLPLLEEYKGPVATLPLFLPLFSLTRLSLAYSRLHTFLAHLQQVRTTSNVPSLNMAFDNFDNATLDRICAFFPCLTALRMRIISEPDTDMFPDGINPQASAFFRTLAASPPLPRTLKHLALSWEFQYGEFDDAPGGGPYLRLRRPLN